MLRPFAPTDAPRVCELAGDRAVADTTANIPHPYEPGMAEAWIATHAPAFAEGKLATFAVVPRDATQVFGAVGLIITPEHNRGELGYWIGRPYWNRGYVTEAARAVIAYGFDTLNLHRVFATHIARNAASGRVMQKLGMTREGEMREHIRKWDTLENMVVYGLLRSEWVNARHEAAKD